jgi:hypothetical protein
MLNTLKNIDDCHTASDKNKRGLGKTEAPLCESGHKGTSSGCASSTPWQREIVAHALRESSAFADPCPGPRIDVRKKTRMQGMPSDPCRV